MARRLGIFLCLLGFAAVVVLPLVLNTKAPFGSLNGIEDDIERAARPLVDAEIIVPEGAAGAEIVADGRDLTITLPEAVTRNPNMAGLTEQLGQIEGVRNVNFGDVAPILLPTEGDPPPAPDPDPTPVPDPDPTAEPDPEPDPVPDPAMTASEVVAELSVLDVEFVPGTATLTAGDTGQLANAANLLSEGFDGGPIQVQSHTSDEGDPDVNFLLTQDRAEAIVQYLISQGVDASRLTAQGFGASQPVADNGTVDGRAENERVVFIVEEG